MERMVAILDERDIALNASTHHARQLLEHACDLDVYSDHGEDTPRRFAEMLYELTEHARCEEAAGCSKWKVFPAVSDEMIVVSDIPFTSLCNHHVIPFMGVVHIGYVPDEKIAGLSKFGRIVDHFSRRLQVQEIMTTEICTWLEAELKPKGIIVVVRAEHLCMAIRGVQKPGALTTTSAVRGVYSDHTKTAKAEFLQFINGAK